MLKIFLSASLASAILFLSPIPSKAYLFGDPTFINKDKRFSMELVYDTGYRKIFEKSSKGFLRYGDGLVDYIEPGSGDPITFKNRRLYANAQAGCTSYMQLFIRLLPGTGRLNFATSQYNPKLYGAGFGIKLSPSKSVGPFRTGIMISWDRIYGLQKNWHTDMDFSFAKFAEVRDTEIESDEFKWRERTIIWGISCQVSEYLRFYSGISYLRSNIYLNLNDYGMSWRNDRAGGGFWGLSYALPGKSTEINMEQHLVNEKNIGITINYYFAALI